MRRISLSLKLFTLSLILAISLLATNVFAQSPDDNISLPDIIITGEAEKLFDTISLEERLSRYWKLRSLKEFEYEPFITPDEVTQYHQTVESNNGVLDLNFGNRYFINFKGLYSDSANPLLNFRAGFHNRMIAEDYTTSQINAGWYPSRNSLDWGIGFDTFSFTDERANRERSLSLQHYKTALKAEQLELQSVSLRDLKLTLIYGESNRKYEIVGQDDKISELDLHLSVTASELVKELNLSLDFNLIRKNRFVTNVGLYKDGFLIFERIGPNILADTNSLIPTLNILFRPLEIGSTRLRVMNIPSIDKRTRRDLLKDNLEQPIDVSKRITKTPLNSYLIFENDRLIPLSLSYNLSWHKDYLYYRPFPDFSLVHTDLLQQRFGLELGYSIGNFDFGNKTEYSINSEKITFVPEWSNLTKLHWKLERLVLETDLHYLINRRNKAGEITPFMEDIMLLNLRARFQLQNNISIYSGVDNLLDSNYRRYEYGVDVIEQINIFDPGREEIPYENIQFYGGISWSF